MVSSVASSILPPRVSLITPTGSRREAFALCERWISQQTYKGPMEWIVIDDGDPPVTCHLQQLLLRPPWRWTSSGQPTLPKNLLQGLPHVTSEYLLFIEDDDYYAPGYVATMVQRLSEAALVGEQNAHYYHVGLGAWHICNNTKHSSLCQIGIRAELLDCAIEVCRRGSYWIDLTLCSEVRDRKLFPYSGQAIGVKGMPGRPGIGVGHRVGWSAYAPDIGGQVFAEWVGADAVHYDPYRRKR